MIQFTPIRRLLNILERKIFRQEIKMAFVLKHKPLLLWPLQRCSLPFYLQESQKITFTFLVYIWFSHLLFNPLQPGFCSQYSAKSVLMMKVIKTFLSESKVCPSISFDDIKPCSISFPLVFNFTVFNEHTYIFAYFTFWDVIEFLMIITFFTS